MAGIPGLAAERLQVLDHQSDEPLSPELVLVSPELRERVSSEEPDARSDLPEDVAPPAAAPPPPAIPAAPPAPAVPRVSARPALPPAMPPAPPLMPPSTQTTAARVEWRLTVGAATVLALCALLVFGAGVAVGQLALPASTTRSPAAPSSSHEPPTASATTPAAAAPGSKAKTARPEAESSHATTRSITAESSGAAAPEAPISSGVLPIPTSTPTATEPRERKSSPVPAHPARQPSKAVRPIPNGGYAFFDGSFQLSGDGLSIVRFMVRTSCAGPLVLHAIQVPPTGAFAFSGHPAGSLPGTTVRLTGRFVSRAEARGTLRVTRATCHDTATPFVAHLS